MKLLRKIYVIMMFLSVAVMAMGQEANDTVNRNAEDFINVYLVVANPSATTYSTLGHDALRMQCKTYGLDNTYSYESEDVEEKIFAFLGGGLKMGMFAIASQDYVDFYKAQGRGVRQYKLNLAPEVKLHLWEILEEEAAKDSYLPYDYLERGCAQSILQFLKQAIEPEQIQYGPWPEKYRQTRREFVSSNLEHTHPWVDCLFSLAVGVEADKEVSNEEKVVIPSDLVEVLQAASVNGVCIADVDPEWLTEKFPQKAFSGITPNMVALLVLVLAIASIWFAPKWSAAIDIVYLTLITLVGLFEMFIWLGHLPNSAWLWLVVPFNVLPAVCWHWRRYWAWAYAIVLLVWIIGMWAYPHTLVNNAYLLFVTAEIVILLKQTDWIKKIINFKDTKR